MAYQQRSAAPTTTIEGVVSATGRGGKGIKIGEVWYGAFAVTQTNGVSVGDSVIFEMSTTERGGQVFNNIKGDVKVVAKQEAPVTSAAASAPSGGGRSGGGGFTPKVFPIPAKHPDRAIIRQNAANRATDIISALLQSNPGILDDIPRHDIPQFALDLARQFESYYSGEID